MLSLYSPLYTSLKSQSDGWRIHAAGGADIGFHVGAPGPVMQSSCFSNSAVLGLGIGEKPQTSWTSEVCATGSSGMIAATELIQGTAHLVNHSKPPSSSSAIFTRCLSSPIFKG